MRKERLIVPVLVGLAVAWAVAQAIAGALFERELARAVADLRARGELSITRDDVERGWLSSSGTLYLRPWLGQAWRLALPYEAHHGLLSTRVDGWLELYLGAEQRPLFGELLPSTAPPRWQARHHVLTETLAGELKLSPFLLRQGERALAFSGADITVDGVYGDWRLRAQLATLRLADGPVSLEAGPLSLESRYAYTAEADHFTQHDRLEIERLAWRSPALTLDGTGLSLHSQTVLDEQELRVRSELTLEEVVTAGQTLLTGRVVGELSRVDGDALRAVLDILGEAAARGDEALPLGAGLAPLAPYLLDLLSDSPRLDLLEVALDSPMLGLQARGEGTLIFDGRRLEALNPLTLDTPAERARWRARLDGDGIWRELPPTMALWLGLPLDTRELQIDVAAGKVYLNGRPMPRLLPPRG